MGNSRLRNAYVILLNNLYRASYLKSQVLCYSLNFSLKYLWLTSLAFVFAHDSKPFFY